MWLICNNLTENGIKFIMILGGNMIKYDNLLIIICILCVVLEILSCIVKLPNIIIYSIPVLLVFVGIFMMIGILRQNKNKKKKK